MTQDGIEQSMLLQEQIMGVTSQNLKDTVEFLVRDFTGSTVEVQSVFSTLMLAVSTRYSCLETYADLTGCLLKEEAFAGLKTLLLTSQIKWASRYRAEELGPCGYSRCPSYRFVMYNISRFNYLLMSKGVLKTAEIRRMLSDIYGMDPMGSQFRQSVSQQIHPWEIESLKVQFIRFLIPEFTNLKNKERLLLVNQIDRICRERSSMSKENPIDVKMLRNQMEVYKQWRDNPEGIDEVVMAIVKDDADMLSKIIGRGDRSFDEQLHFDKWSTFSTEDMFCLDFAARQGSVECFRYLFANSQLCTEDRILGYAVMGGSTEIVRLVEQMDIEKDDNCIRDAILLAIRHHRYELLSWLVETHTALDVMLIETAVCCDNLHALQLFFELDPNLNMDPRKSQVVRPREYLWGNFDYSISWDCLVAKWESSSTLQFLLAQGIFGEKERVPFLVIDTSFAVLWTRVCF